MESLDIRIGEGLSISTRIDGLSRIEQLSERLVFRIEFQRFMRGPAHALFTRLVSNAGETGERLIEYIEQLPQALASYDTMPLRAFAFACTGSAYLVGSEREEQSFLAEFT